MFHGVNWIAVVVAALAFFALGAVWYTALFGRRWAKAASIDWDNPGGNMPLIFGMTLLLEIVAATAIAIILHATGLEGWQGGLHLGLILGLGIVTPAVAINNLYQRKPFALTAIDAGHLTLGLILAGVIIGLFG